MLIANKRVCKAMNVFCTGKIKVEVFINRWGSCLFCLVNYLIYICLYIFGEGKVI